MKSIYRLVFLISLVILTALSMINPMTIFAEQEDNKIQPPPMELSDYAKLRDSVEAAINAEKTNAAEIEKQLDEAKNAVQIISSEINAFKIQMSAHANMLPLDEIPLQNLETAWIAHKYAVEKIESYVSVFLPKKDESLRKLNQTQEQLEINQLQLSEFKSSKSIDPLTENVINQMKMLTTIISAKLSNLKSISEIYSKIIADTQNIQQAMKTFSEKFETRIKARKIQVLFVRKDTPIFSLNKEQIKADFNQLLAQSQVLFKIDILENELKPIVRSGWLLFLFFLALFVIIQSVMFKIQKSFSILGTEKELCEKYPWGALTIRQFQSSLMLIGATVFVYIYADVRDYYDSIPMVRMIVWVLMIWLFTRWGSDFIRNWNQQGVRPLPGQISGLAKILLLWIRMISILYLFLDWMVGSGSTILLIVRLFFEFSLLLWGAALFRKLRKLDGGDAPMLVEKLSAMMKAMRSSDEKTTDPKDKLYLILKAVIIVSADVIISGSLILELAGYGPLAIHWFASWGKSLAVILWGILLFRVLLEWDKAYRESFSTSPKALDPIRWLVIKVSWIVWVFAFFALLAAAWGATMPMIVSFFKILGEPVQVGGMSLSFSGFVFACLVLLMTHTIAKLWGQTFLKKILYGSGLETGIKDSITAITVYLLWAFGITIALHVAGIGTTSITVALGALGIGLGFGLQNIFNNFVSGIIMLLERPIEVGDSVEIGGVWGEVRNINVRSTLVQTFDNASMIIPNSEFISNKVINWTFKDTRVRRGVDIGVAYGSDTTLVKNTLLEIADNTPYVFKYPEPSVLFTAFADSSLNFRLRVWTDVSNSLSVETHIRYEIDRLFRERNITIPFPQRDINLTYREK